MAYSSGNADTALSQKIQLSSRSEQNEAAKKMRNARSPFSSPASGISSNIDSSLLRKSKVESPEDQRKISKSMRMRRSDISRSGALSSRGLLGRSALRGGGGRFTRPSRSNGRFRSANNGGDEADSKEKGGDMAVDNSAKMATAKFLRTAWLSMTSLVAIPICWLYINIHAFCLNIPGIRNLFCQLGSEWLPANVANNEWIASKIKKFSTLEKMLILLVDFIVLLAFIVLVFFTVLIVKLLFGSIFERIGFLFQNWDILKGLF
jgi:hypothetical protein